MAVKDHLSVQLYSLRSLGTMEPILEAITDAGFRHVELLGSHLDKPDETAKKLVSLNVRASSSHVGLEQLRQQPDAMIAAAQRLDIQELYMPALPEHERSMAGDGWRALGLELGRLAERFLRDGVHLGYHNHDWELAVKEEGSTALDVLFTAAGTSPLTWQADVAWLIRGGADPDGLLTRYADRLCSAHVKDIAKAGEGLEEDGWADVGHGIVDWPTLWPLCRARGAGWMVVEHDRPADPARFAKRSYAFLNGMEG